MSVKQVRRILSTYTADVSGVCSALYELGGMVVIHDPSGCNSTYNTHDEPRWYEKDSLIFISGLSEIDAIMGSDEKFINDIVSAAKTFAPKFIALVQTPIPYMTGFDFSAAAAEIEERTGIDTWFMPTNGMHSYLYGAGKAFLMLVERYVKKNDRKESDGPVRVNLLGATPLDFSVGTTIDSIKRILTENKFTVNTVFALGCSLEDIKRAGEADVNLVISAAGYEAARRMEELFDIPYVLGVPVMGLADRVLDDLLKTAADHKSRMSYGICSKEQGGEKKLVAVGEPVMAQSVAASLFLKYSYHVKVICPLDADKKVFADFCEYLPFEDEISDAFLSADVIIGDPIYRYIAPESARFISFPHEAFSGRIYRKEIPDPCIENLCNKIIKQ